MCHWRPENCWCDSISKKQLKKLKDKLVRIKDWNGIFSPDHLLSSLNTVSDWNEVWHTYRILFNNIKFSNGLTGTNCVHLQ